MFFHFPFQFYVTAVLAALGFYGKLANGYLNHNRPHHQINIKSSDGFIFNNQKIDEHNLHKFLDQHEIDLLFGGRLNDLKFHGIKTSSKVYQIVNVEHKIRRKRSTSRHDDDDDNDDDDDDDGDTANTTNILNNNHNKIINLYLNSANVNNNNSNNNNSNNSSSIKNKQILLNKSDNLLDDAFIFIRRYNNFTEFIDNSTFVKNQLDNCFYRNEISAFDLCDGKIHGIFRENATNLLIHPLPSRFGHNYHILVEANRIPSYSELKNFEPEYQATRRSSTNRTNEYADYGHHGVRQKRNFVTSTNANEILNELHIETAIFVDRDLYRHMEKNYPKNTESNLIRFVLAMVNGVQLLYHHPSLGHKINFVLKRLEILYSDPKDLRRSSDIDIFLNSFCSWQKNLNPPNDENAVHYDHAVILTGLDLYVVSKNGKISSQVVGLAPVAGMCTTTSSCTINEGKHFESVYVVAHEIGHNLGMRHDTADSNCDPSLYIMSPTLGSGKITWSKCSRDYLNSFLKSTQSKCLLDRGHFSASLDHSAEGMLPGERFDADQQCMLKYGKDSTRSPNQHLNDICRDLHCQRDRYTWTSHPALEGTTCGDTMWCKSGVCTLKSAFLESYSIPKQISITSVKAAERSNLIDERRFNTLKSDPKVVNYWSDWGPATECESGCLYGNSGRLREGSAGLRVYQRSCIDYRNRKKCHGSDKKYESCTAKQCYSVPRTTVSEFANQICERAREFDYDLTGIGVQKAGESPEDACKVHCEMKSGATKSRTWTFPDGTVCLNKDSDAMDNHYCVAGRCEKFACTNATSNFFKMDATFCPESFVVENQIKDRGNNAPGHVIQENGRDYKSVDFKPHYDSRQVNKTRNEVIQDNDGHQRRHDLSNPSYAKSEAYHGWRSTNNYDRVGDTQKSSKDEWIVKSGCHFSCMEQSKGIEIINSKYDMTSNIRLCLPDSIVCNKLQATYDFATNICQKFKLKVRGLSGTGMQISPSVHEPDRSCRVACQDYYLQHRFYLVNGEQGHFPFGTKCSKTENRYCVNGKCLEFGADNLPVKESHFNLALFRSKRFIDNTESWKVRKRRNFLYYTPINITERIEQKLIDNLVANINFSLRPDKILILDEGIDLRNPIYLSTEDFHHH